MRYRYEGLVVNETATTAATKTVDLDFVEPISRLTVQFKGTNNGSTPTAHGAKMVSLLEIADGSDIMYSLSGIEAQALNYYENGDLPFQVNEYRNDVMNIQTFQLNFGRYKYDPELALDPNRFRNLQLKITHNKASGGSAPDAGALWVYADLFDEKRVNPMGFLQSKEHYTYSLTSSGVESIDLPTDLTIRKMLVQSLSGGKQPWQQYNKVKLTEDEGRKTVINDIKTSDLSKTLKRHPHMFETLRGIGTGSVVDHFCASTYDMESTLGADSTSLSTVTMPQDYGGTIGINADNAEHFQAHIRGAMPHGALEVPFGMQEDLRDWYDLNGVGALKLALTAGSSVGSSSTAEVVLQQLRRY